MNRNSLDMLVNWLANYGWSAKAARARLVAIVAIDRWTVKFKGLNDEKR